jgi:hypothetical protein
MPKIKAVNHFNQNFPILRCPKTNSAGFTPPACKPKAYGLEGIDHFLSPTPETLILAFGLCKSDAG